MKKKKKTFLISLSQTKPFSPTTYTSARVRYTNRINNRASVAYSRTRAVLQSIYEALAISNNLNKSVASYAFVDTYPCVCIHICVRMALPHKGSCLLLVAEDHGVLASIFVFSLSLSVSRFPRSLSFAVLLLRWCRRRGFHWREAAAALRLYSC